MGGALDPAELEAFDANLFGAIAGDAGGTWAPATVITVGGSGITVGGEFRATDVRNFVINAAGTLTANGVVTLNAVLDITGTGTLNLQSGADAEFNGTVNTYAAVNFETGNIHVVEGNWTFDATSFLTIDSGCSVDATLSSGSQITLETGSLLTAESGSDVALAGDTVLSGIMQKSGTLGRIRNRALGLPANNTNWTADVDADYWLYAQTSTTPRTVTCRRTTAPTPLSGDEMHIRILITASSGTVTVTNETSGNDVAVFTSAAGGGGANVTVVYDGSDWRAGSCTTWGAVTAAVGAAF